jgi:hypothetical protein
MTTTTYRDFQRLLVGEFQGASNIVLARALGNELWAFVGRGVEAGNRASPIVFRVASNNNLPLKCRRSWPSGSIRSRNAIGRAAAPARNVRRLMCTTPLDGSRH